MNTAAIKNFAVTARKKLSAALLQKAGELGITHNEIMTPTAYRDGFLIEDKFFKRHQIEQREILVQKVIALGFDYVIEESAFIWFKRFVAIRYMEVNGFLAGGMRLLSSKDRDKIFPDALTEALTIAAELELDANAVSRLQNDREALFRYLLIKQCNKLAEMMPMAFEPIENGSELLLPGRLLEEGSVVNDLIIMIREEDWKGHVEIIGWLYQQYISEKKNQVFADLKKNKKIAKENIPAATQLFTPEWIVRYLVENSLGRLWLETYPDKALQRQWKYYLEQPAQHCQETVNKLERIKHKDVIPEEIKILDPCMGSGHILLYAFDVLYLIYKRAGYKECDIPGLILEHNLYGLDIDERAAQLAYFSLIMKARSYNRYFFNKKTNLHILSIQESNELELEAIDCLVSLHSGDKSALKEALYYLKDVFHDAREYGSILHVKEIDFKRIKELLIKAETMDTDHLFTLKNQLILKEKLPLLVQQMKMMSQTYTITITNPPYMGFKGMNHRLFHYLKKFYPHSKTDLSAVFLEKLLDFTKENGFTACIAPHSWMFLSRYEKLRCRMLQEQTLYSMVHLGPKAFAEIGGEVVQTAAFTGRKIHMPKLVSPYIRLIKYDNPTSKQQEFFNVENRYFSSQAAYFDLPNRPVAYWTNESARRIFKNHKKLLDIALPNTGLQTSDNKRFLRFWYEIDRNKIGFNLKNNNESINSGKKWFPYNKGGSYRKWYGNQDYVVNWENNGLEIREYNKYLNSSRSSSIGIGSVEYYFRESISWSKIGTETFSARYSPPGFIFDVGGSSLFPNGGKEIYLLLALLNSKTAIYFLSLLNPTMNFQVGNISSIPIPDWAPYRDEIERLAKENMIISKVDWDSYETSWDFTVHPFVLNNCPTIQRAYEKWRIHKAEQRSMLKNNEETLNKLFIEMFGLHNEVNPLVSDDEIALTKENREYDIKLFISYAIGCMFGRYSLDTDGAVFSERNSVKEKSPLFYPNDDNILPITDDEYLENDIVNRFIAFIRAIFGQETLEENLDFIADSLAIKTGETSRERLHRYFLQEFFKDHVQIYHKRPIYWLFDSGRHNGFKALIYMHRYDAETIPKMRTNYLNILQGKYETEISRNDHLLKSAVSLKEKTNAIKRNEELQRQLSECRQYEKCLDLAAKQKIDIDLDDGVIVNYEKFQNIETLQDKGGKTITHLLAKI